MTVAQARSILKSLEFKNGLITAVARDYKKKDVLMVAFQDREAVLKTLTTGVMHYWSRSRKRLWKKGERSGHIQKVNSARVDCDGDAILFDVEQVGAACHAGYRSCFHRRVRRGKLAGELKKKFRPEEAYR
ncbi:MAG: phosphoribosyl-AMP cyclohydrolase [Candidatus Hadarchaeota archaeon]